MKTRNSIIGLACLLATAGCAGQQEEVPRCVNTLRAPAYPLVTIDPYTSAWSMQDNLYDGPVRHWTGRSFPLLGVLTVDGESYRFLGQEDRQLNTLLPCSEEETWQGSFTLTQPKEGWERLGFDDTAWKRGAAAFGTKESEQVAQTQWGTPHIWVRRSFTLSDDLSGRPIYLDYTHDDDVTIYINGIKVVETGDACAKHVQLKLTDEVTASLRKGDNLIAATCHNRRGNALLDFGLKEEKKEYLRFARSAVQRLADVQATQTHYTLECGAVELKLSFTAPLLLEEMEMVSRPVNYLTYSLTSKDGRSHEVSLHWEAGPQWALDEPEQPSVIECVEEGSLSGVRAGSVRQDILGKRGDDVRIDWGYFYLMAPKGEAVSHIDHENGCMTLQRDLGCVEQAAGHLLLAYDDIYSIQYFGQNLRPYWNRQEDQTIGSQLAKAEKEYGQRMTQCEALDRELMEKATKVGGRAYAELCALAYRQAIAAHKLVQTAEGETLYLSKENFSNGSIGTVDVTYPSAPLFLLYNPELLKGMMNPIFHYTESGRWKKPFAAHDVGTYPLANGQTYGGDMPVEDCGNMLFLTSAIAAVEGHAQYAESHWKSLTEWVAYLEKHGLDPDNQLCTDDFAGHWAHNANLSVKSIVAIGCYSQLAAALGQQEVAKKYYDLAKEMAGQWMKLADDGDHYRLAFDRPNTWSQKYNLVWDKLLKWGLFPEEVAQKELAYYLKQQRRYGLPLDCRESYTKTDWVIWTATMAPDSETFEALVEPIHRMMNETESRVPMSDWMQTDSARQRGFQARSVVGGYFIRLLEAKLNQSSILTF